ncbi:Hypothetical protein FKW44_004216 [Caligus rogercresseyi]|uniref:Uncharacterized protein n=1 Tax=Caligus rogercresseyi TaxID=217165 RepID=A0A7T8KBA1_CALRO|nr:Hypothetical protein FKW44_004216 [Caligus rogercresseyi]
MTEWTLKASERPSQVVGFWSVPQGYHEHAWGKPHLHLAYQKVIKKTGKPQGGLNKEGSDQCGQQGDQVVACKILRHPTHSMNKMAQEYNVSARTIKVDLSMKPFKYRKIYIY